MKLIPWFAQVERDLKTVGPELMRTFYPGVRHRELGKMLKLLAKLRERVELEPEKPQTKVAPASAPPAPPSLPSAPINYHPGACARKRSYKTPEAAGRAATKAHQNGSTDTLRVYECKACDAYHLTHLSLEAFAAAQQSPGAP